MENSKSNKVFTNVVCLHMRIIVQALHSKRALLPVLNLSLDHKGVSHMHLLPEDNLLAVY